MAPWLAMTSASPQSEGRPCLRRRGPWRHRPPHAGPAHVHPELWHRRPPAFWLFSSFPHVRRAAAPILPPRRRVAAVGSGWIELDRELPFPVQSGWQAVVHSYYPSVQEGGMESLTIAFE